MNSNALKQQFIKAGKALGLTGAALMAYVNEALAVATPIDVTSVTDQIAAAVTPIGLIGAGVLLVFVTIKTYKWVRRAM